MENHLFETAFAMLLQGCSNVTIVGAINSAIVAIVYLFPLGTISMCAPDHLTNTASPIGWRPAIVEYLVKADAGKTGAKLRPVIGQIGQ
jgi:hypothetical protein